MNKLTNDQMTLWVLLTRTNELISRYGEFLFRDAHLTKTQYGTLHILDLLAESRKTRIKITDLVPYLNRSAASISLILDRMEKKRLVKRVRNIYDRRTVYITITSKGKKLLAKTVNPTAEYAVKILSGFSDEELKESIKIMNKLLDLVERETYTQNDRPLMHNMPINQLVSFLNKLGRH